MVSFKLTGNINAKPSPKPSPSNGRKFWIGIRDDNPKDMPAVIPAQVKMSNGNWSKYGKRVEFTRSIQLKTWEMFSGNPTITKKNWRSIMDANTWGTNFNGWRDGVTPRIRRADYVTPQDIDTQNPYLMDAIVMSGSPLSFEEKGEYLFARPGIDGIDSSKPLPSVQTIVENKWYFKLVNIGNNGLYDFAQGHGGPVLMPYFLPPEGATYNKAYFALASSVQ